MGLQAMDEVEEAVKAPRLAQVLKDLKSPPSAVPPSPPDTWRHCRHPPCGNPRHCRPPPSAGSTIQEGFPSIILKQNNGAIRCRCSMDDCRLL